MLRFWLQIEQGSIWFLTGFNILGKYKKLLKAPKFLRNNSTKLMRNGIIILGYYSLQLWRIAHAKKDYKL